jgi:hypothetical protein
VQSKILGFSIRHELHEIKKIVKFVQFVPELFVQCDGTAIALGVIDKEFLNVFGIGTNTFFVTIVAVDEHNEMGSSERHFGALMVASRRTYTTLGISINGQSGNV